MQEESLKHSSHIEPGGCRFCSSNTAILVMRHSCRELSWGKDERGMCELDHLVIPILPHCTQFLKSDWMMHYSSGYWHASVFLSHCESNISITVKCHYELQSQSYSFSSDERVVLWFKPGVISLLDECADSVRPDVTSAIISNTGRRWVRLLRKELYFGD